jgi:hypothetical protein
MTASPTCCAVGTRAARWEHAPGKRLGQDTERAERYRRLAAELRRAADEMKDPEQKRMVLALAGMYLRLAAMAREDPTA